MITPLITLTVYLWPSLYMYECVSVRVYIYVYYVCILYV